MEDARLILGHSREVLPTLPDGRACGLVGGLAVGFWLGVELGRRFGW